MLAVERAYRLPGKLYRSKEDNFTWDLKQEAMRLTDWRCFLTGERGTRSDPLEVHHGLAVAAWFHYFREIVPHAVLVSIHNAIPLKHSIHMELHKQADMIHWTQMATHLIVRAREDVNFKEYFKQE